MENGLSNLVHDEKPSHKIPKGFIQLYTTTDKTENIKFDHCINSS